MDQQLKNWFTHGKIHQVIWKSSMPMVGAILALFAYDLLESSLLALNGEHLLTALGFTLPITTALAAIAIGTSIRTNNKVVKFACLHKDKLANVIATSIIISVIVIAFLSIIFYLMNDYLLALLGSQSWSESITDDIDFANTQHTYLNARYLGWVFLTIIWQVNATLRALGNTTLASCLMLSWLLVKSMLAIALLTPESLWHLPGLSGLALSHVGVDMLFALISLLLLANKTALELPSFKELRSAVLSTKHDGLFIILQQLITPISIALLTMIAATIDYSYVAAFAFILRIESLLLLLPMVLTTSMPCIVGINYWSGHMLRVKEAYFITFFTLVLSQFILAILLYLNSDLLSSFICAEGAVAQLITNFLTWVPIGYIGAGCAIVYQSCLNSEGKTLQASFIGITHKLLLLLPIAYIGASIASENSFFQAIMLGHLVSGLYVIYLFKKRTAVENNKAQGSIVYLAD
ncbi:MAG: Na+-driven multidrug efflux pump [Alteromonadaceae bacterium]|jgi:Na+-driven multidrug efflux pump